MLHNVHLITLVMSAVAAVWALVSGRSPNATPEVRRASANTILISLAVMLGVTPQALLPENEWLQTAGPVASIVFSVFALFVMRRWRSTQQAR